MHDSNGDLIRRDSNHKGRRALLAHGRDRHDSEDASLSLRVAQLEDAVAVLQAAVAHCKGLAEAATAAMSAGAFQHQPDGSPLHTQSTSLPVSPTAPRRAEEVQADEAAPVPIPRKPTPPWQPLRLPPNTGHGLGLEPLPAQQQQQPPPMSPPPPPPPHLVPPRLQEQVLAVVNQIDLEVDSQAPDRQKIYESISRRIRRAWPLAEIVCYGSMRTACATPTSDMDRELRRQIRPHAAAPRCRAELCPQRSSGAAMAPAAGSACAGCPRCPRNATADLRVRFVPRGTVVVLNAPAMPASNLIRWRHSAPANPACGELCHTPCLTCAFSTHTRH